MTSMMLRKIIPLIFLIEFVFTSLVIDSKSQGNIDVNDYCPKMKFCPEGSHILCMYEQNKMGPLCTDAREIPLTEDKIKKILDITNMIRSRIARGKEKGKDDELLPRGYGIFRLKWDPVLSAFAQVLSNQCLLGHDICHATNRFPDPSQISGMIRFKLNWDTVKASDIKFQSGFNNPKVLYAMNRVLHSWYDHKSSVTPNHTTSYPNYDANPLDMRGRLYLRMVYGAATHIGCGITAYSQFNFKHDVRSNAANFILVICNLSASPHKSRSVYNTVPPGDTTVLTNPCGCPAGSKGDDMCLCVDDEEGAVQMVVPQQPACQEGLDCDPSLVVLPIFTVEDAPPEKLFHNKYTNITNRKTGMDRYLQRNVDMEDLTRKNIQRKVPQFVNTPQPQKHNIESLSYDLNNALEYKPPLHHVSPKLAVIDSNKNQLTHELSTKYDIKQNLVPHRKSYLNKNTRLGASNTLNQGSNLKYELPQETYMDSNINLRVGKNIYLENKSYQNKPYFNKIKNQNLGAESHAFVDQNHIEPHKHGENTESLQRVPRKKGSIFGRPAKFQLPLKIYDHIKPEHKAIEIKDVVPRKDFSNAKELLDKYLFHKNPIIKGSSKINKQATNNVYYNEVSSYASIPTKHVIADGQQRTISTDHMQHVLSILKATQPRSKGNRHHTKMYSILANTRPELITQTVSYKKQVNENVNNDLDTVGDYNDNRLMALLDTLEQEVKHVELRDKHKKIFDEKIRKIYGRVVGKHVGLLDLKTEVNKPSIIKRRLQHKDNNSEKKSIQQEPEDPLREKELVVKKALEDLISDPRYNIKDKDKNTTLVEDDIKSNKYNSKDFENGINKLEKGPYQNFEERRILTHLNNKERHEARDIDESKARDDNIYERDQYRDDTNNKRRHVVGFDQNRRSSTHSRQTSQLLSRDRRQYYQDKLENLERRLQTRRKLRKSSPPAHMRPMKSENQMDFYGRARLSHGY